MWKSSAFTCGRGSRNVNESLQKRRHRNNRKEQTVFLFRFALIFFVHCYAHRFVHYLFNTPTSYEHSALSHRLSVYAIFFTFILVILLFEYGKVKKLPFFVLSFVRRCFCITVNFHLALLSCCYAHISNAQIFTVQMWKNAEKKTHKHKQIWQMGMGMSLKNGSVEEKWKTKIACFIFPHALDCSEKWSTFKTEYFVYMCWILLLVAIYWYV